MTAEDFIRELLIAFPGLDPAYIEHCESLHPDVAPDVEEIDVNGGDLVEWVSEAVEHVEGLSKITDGILSLQRRGRVLNGLTYCEACGDEVVEDGEDTCPSCISKS